MDNLSVFATFLTFFISCSTVHSRQIICLDQKSDFDEHKWSFSTDYKYIENSDQLPRSFGNLKFLTGQGLWFVEGKNPAKDIVLKSDTSLYLSNAKTVKIYLKFYEQSPRRVSLYPTKGTRAGLISLIPISSPGKWTEASYDIDPKESPIELTAYLGSNQFLILEKIIIAIDNPLPTDPNTACSDLAFLANVAKAGTTVKPSRSQSVPGTGNNRSPSSPVNPSCPAPPMIPECKCNCNCNCNKLCD